MRRVRLSRSRKRKLTWLLAAFGTAAVATIVGARYRQAKLDAESELLAGLLDVGPGKVIAEIGAGHGQMSIRIARQLRLAGRVLATEFEPKKLRRIRRAVQTAKVENVSVIQGSETGAELPSEACDAIFMRGVYHHLTAPTLMNHSLLRALRPGGRLAVIDFPPRLLLSLWTPKGIPDNRGGHGIYRQLLEEEVRQAGFEVIEYWDDWPSRTYCALFRKPAS